MLFQVLTKVQTVLRQELDARGQALEQRGLDVLRKEMQSALAAEMTRLEPALKLSGQQMLNSIVNSKQVLRSPISFDFLSST